jgi:ketoreductase RED1
VERAVTGEPVTVAVIGAGTIGVSWATLFAAHGYQVRICDPRPDLQEVVEQAVQQFSQTLPGGPRDPHELLARLELVPSVAEAASGVVLVQENGPERVEFKREVFASLEAGAPPSALLLSSTSGILPRDMSQDMTEPGRLVIGHPFNPPHVLPLVEVVPGEATSASLVERVVSFYRGIGKQPVVLHKEIGGFVANRLQGAVNRESFHLVLEGVVSTEELDKVVTESLGPRYATAGPFESLHLGGGPGGLRHMLEHLGPGMQRRWDSLGTPSLTPETVQRVSEEVERRFEGISYEQHTARRDRMQLAVLAARERAWAESGSEGAALDQPADAPGEGAPER